MHVHDSLLDLIGATPLVRLGRIARDVPATVLAKVEFLNPGGSSKDRIALGMVRRAEADGRLRPGATIVEPTSGNTGVGLAMVAALHGYRAVFTCPDKVSGEKIDLLRAYGAEVVVCSAALPFDHPGFYRNQARAIAAERPGAVLLDQYSNQANPESHHATTGPEIWRQTEGRVTHFVAGVGTGGTLSGAGRHLKERSDGAVTVIGADPDGSAYTSDAPRPYLLEGVGQPALPGSYDPAVPDRLEAVTDRESLEISRRLAREEGMLVGGSGGMAVAVALRTAARLGPDDVVVVLVPDSGRGYISKIFNDAWMERHGFPVRPAATAGPDLAMVLAGIGHRSAVTAIVPETTVGAALAVMRGQRLPALPVAAAPPPVRHAEVLGTITERTVARILADDPAAVDGPVLDHAGPVLPIAGIGQPAAAALAAMEGHDAVLVLDGGAVCGLVTRSDLAEALAAAGGVRSAAPVGAQA